MISFSHVIFYVKDLEAAIAFYKDTFGVPLRFMHESGQYVELETGMTTLAFASETLAQANLPAGYIANDIKMPPLASEIVFTVDDVCSIYKTALQAGAVEVTSPAQKPWGQTVAYVRDPNGVLVELASPIT